MLMDLHAHSAGISRCCRIPADQVIQAAMDAGIEGLVLTNHYQKCYVKDGDAAEFARRYVEEYHFAKSAGDACGFSVWFGIEATMERLNGAHILIYGVGEDFVLDYPDLYDYPMERLARLVREQGGVLIQAHPLRRKYRLLEDLQYVDGLELSCHPLYDGTHMEELFEVAKNNGLILTCGGDYHADTYRPRCGIYLPEEITSVEALAHYLKSTESVALCVHEVGEATWNDVTFQREKMGETNEKATT